MPSLPGPDSRPSTGWFQLSSLPACSAPLQGAEVVTTQGHKVLPAYPPYCLSSPLLSRTIAIAVLTDFLFPVDKQNPLSWHVNPCPTAHSQHCPVGLLQFSTQSTFSSTQLWLIGSPLHPLPRLCLENPHSVLMVPPGCSYGKPYPSHPPPWLGLVSLPHVPVLLCFTDTAFISPRGKYTQLLRRSGDRASDGGGQWVTQLMFSERLTEGAVI